MSASYAHTSTRRQPEPRGSAEVPGPLLLTGARGCSPAQLQAEPALYELLATGQVECIHAGRMRR